MLAGSAVEEHDYDGCLSESTALKEDEWRQGDGEMKLMDDRSNGLMKHRLRQKRRRLKAWEWPLDWKQLVRSTIQYKLRYTASIKINTLCTLCGKSFVAWAVNLTCVDVLFVVVTLMRPLNDTHPMPCKCVINICSVLLHVAPIVAVMALT